MVSLIPPLIEKLERGGEGGRQFLVLHQDLHPDAISCIALGSESHNLICFYYFFFQEATILPLHLLREVFNLILSDRIYRAVETGLPPVLVLPHHLLSTFHQWYS